MDCIERMPVELALSRQAAVAEEVLRPARSRMEWIDVARGVAILLVVSHHAGFHFPLIQYFRIPLFYITAGYLFNFERHGENLIQYLGWRSRRLLLPYFLTAILFFGATWAINSRYDPGQALHPFRHFLGIFLGNGAARSLLGADYILGFNLPLWFLACLTSATAIFILLLNAFRNDAYRTRLILSSIAIALFGRLIGEKRYLPWSFDVAMIVQLFMVTGFLLRQNKATFADRQIFLVLLGVYLCLGVSGITIDLNNRTFNDFGEMFVEGLAGTYVVYYLCRKLTEGSLASWVRPLTEALRFFGRHTLVIMAFHIGAYPLWTVLKNVFPAAGLPGTLNPAQSFGLMLAVSLAAIAVITRARPLRAVYYK